MSREDFEKFRLLVLRDFSLQEQFRSFTDTNELIAQIIEIGGKRGFQITTEDVEEAMRANSRLWIERWI